MWNKQNQETKEKPQNENLIQFLQYISGVFSQQKKNNVFFSNANQNWIVWNELKTELSQNQIKQTKSNKKLK